MQPLSAGRRGSKPLILCHMASWTNEQQKGQASWLCRFTYSVKGDLQVNIAMCACTGSAGGALGLQALVWPVKGSGGSAAWSCTSFNTWMRVSGEGSPRKGAAVEDAVRLAWDDHGMCQSLGNDQPCAHHLA